MGDPNGIGHLTQAIEGRHPPSDPGRPVRIGVLPGEGIGPEVVRAALGVLDVVAAELGVDLVISEREAATEAGDLSEEDIEFCRDTFASGGAVFAGPHGGRWVYELRRRFDLFCKLSPVQPSSAIDRIDAPIRPSRLEGVDLLLVREQTGGVYQGRWGESLADDGTRIAVHSFSYRQSEVRRILEIGAALARRRRGSLAVVVKDGGIPSISRLWRDCAIGAAGDDLSLEVLDADHAVYRMLRYPRELDVIVAPNLFGDMLSDAAGALLGSRGITHAGSFDAAQAAVYQTNHGAARDIAGADRANPAGQILAAAMMLRESFGLTAASRLIERALTEAWHQGWRTADIAEPASRVIGTREMGERVAGRVWEVSRGTAAEADAARR
jgi:3-isopropylmalate dehydrogenase